MNQLVSELTKQHISNKEDISAPIRESFGSLQAPVYELRETVDSFLDTAETRAGENSEMLVAAEKSLKSLQMQNTALLA